MKQLTFLFSTACLMAFMACNEPAKDGDATNENKDTAVAVATETPAPPMDSAAQMKAWMDYMTPGEQHKMLAASEGKWKTETTMWMSEGAPPTQSTGEAENKMILGGRYQRSIHKGSFNGMPFEGESITGYDNGKKVFVSTWIDNMGTGVMHMEGPWDEATKSITLKGVCVDPTTGKDMQMREVYKIVDDKNQTMEMYMTQNGKETKSMEIKLTKM